MTCLGLALIATISLLAGLALSKNSGSLATNQSTLPADEKIGTNGGTSISGLGKPLEIAQHANTTRQFVPQSLPTNTSFTLVDGWMSHNTTLLFDGVNGKKDWAINGGFTSGQSPWIYYESDSALFTPYGVSSGYIQMRMNSGANGYNGDKAYYYETTSVTYPLSPGSLAEYSVRFRVNYYNPPTGALVYMATIINGVEVNQVREIDTLPDDSWVKLSLIYDPIESGQVIQGVSPGVVTLRAGFAINQSLTPSNTQYLYMDDIQFLPWVSPNVANVVTVKDLDTSITYPYVNITTGSGKVFMPVAKDYSGTRDATFTISANLGYFSAIDVTNVTVSACVSQVRQSTVDSIPGSTYVASTGDVRWNTQFMVMTPSSYVNQHLVITKHAEWAITSLIDGFGRNKTNETSGFELGSTSVVIPRPSLSDGLWTALAFSWNRIDSVQVRMWNGTTQLNATHLHPGEKFEVLSTINNSVPLAGSRLNCTIFYPNGSVYWSSFSEPVSATVSSGNFTVASTDPMGAYQIVVEWFNDPASSNKFRVGFARSTYSVVHRMNMTALVDRIETIIGSPLLAKVSLIDTDTNKPIDWATISYNTTFGTFGIGIYMGSGVYGAEINTSSAAIGEYNVSFTSAKSFYENITSPNIICLVVQLELISIQVPRSVNVVQANSYALFRFNVTGVNTHNFYYPVNVSVTWFRNYTVTDFNNGTYGLNLSTYETTNGSAPQIWSIPITVNKTDHGSASDVIVLQVNPLPSQMVANATIVFVETGKPFSVEFNYTSAMGSLPITGANLSISWPGFHSYVSNSSTYIVTCNTTGMAFGMNVLLVVASHAGYADGFSSIGIIIQPIASQITLLNPEPINFIKGDIARIHCLFTAGGINITGANVTLVGGIHGTFTWNGSEFVFDVNTSNLEVKTYLVQVIASGDQVLTSIKDLFITILPVNIIVQPSRLSMTLAQNTTDSVITISVFDDSHGQFRSDIPIWYQIGNLTGYLDVLPNGSTYIDVRSLGLQPSSQPYEITIIASNPYGENESVVISIFVPDPPKGVDTLAIIILSTILAAFAAFAIVATTKKQKRLTRLQKEIKNVRDRIMKKGNGTRYVGIPREKLIEKILDIEIHIPSNLVKHAKQSREPAIKESRLASADMGIDIANKVTPNELGPSVLSKSACTSCGKPFDGDAFLWECPNLDCSAYYHPSCFEKLPKKKNRLVCKRCSRHLRKID